MILPAISLHILPKSFASHLLLPLTSHSLFQVCSSYRLKETADLHHCNHSAGNFKLFLSLCQLYLTSEDHRATVSLLLGYLQVFFLSISVSDHKTLCLLVFKTCICVCIHKTHVKQMLKPITSSNLTQTTFGE